MKINSKNLLPFVQGYFTTIGLKSEALSFFTSQRFGTGIVLCLPDVCLLPGNKPALSRSKQTHIHVTGDGRYFFFSSDVIDNLNASSDDKRQSVVVSKANIQHLNNRALTSFPSMNNVNTYTHTKVAYRANQDSQVQISKIRLDGSDFISLRRGLFTHDLLIFLKYKNEDMFFAVGIPAAFYQNVYELPSYGYLKHLESPGNITIRNALKDIEETIDPGALITAPEDISDIIYQKLVDDAEAEEDNDTYVAEKYEPPSTGRTTSSNRPSTNPRLGKAAIKRNGYRCIFSTESQIHETFLKPDGTMYMEVHHLIPLEQQCNFDNKLDTKANLVPVCPLCHRKLHHGRKVDIDEMLSVLYAKRHELLAQSGLSITEDKLKSYY